MGTFTLGSFSERADTAGAGQNPPLCFCVFHPLEIRLLFFPVCGVVVASEELPGAAHLIGFFTNSALLHN